MRKLVLAVLAVLMFAVSFQAEAACTSAIANRSKQLVLQGYFLQADTPKMAFYTSTAAFDSTTTQYTTSNEITGTNYSAGGYSLSGFATGTSTSTSWWTFTNLSQSAVTFNSPSTCALVYDSTDKHTSCTGSGAPYACCTGSSAGCAGDVVMFVLNFTSIQPSAGTLSVNWPTADSSNAIYRIALSEKNGDVVATVYPIEHRCSQFGGCFDTVGRRDIGVFPVGMQTTMSVPQI